MLSQTDLKEISKLFHDDIGIQNLTKTRLDFFKETPKKHL